MLPVTPTHSVGGDSGIFFSILLFQKHSCFFYRYLHGLELPVSMADYRFFVSITLSIIKGIIIVVIMATLFYYMSKLSDSGTLNINNAIHKNRHGLLNNPR
jgi:hypothetical protein